MNKILRFSFIKILFFLFLSLNFSHVFAGDVPAWKSGLLKVISKVTSESEAKKLLGIDDSQITMPEIPKLESNATSTEIYSKVKEVVPDSYKKLSKEEKNKFNYKYLKELFLTVRNQNATDREIGSLLNVLEQGGSREGVYRSIVLDKFYEQLSHENNPSSEKLCLFVIDFMGTYLSLTTQKEVLLKTNFYWLKRYLVEKSLEIADLLSAKPDDFQNWYAIISADFAKKYPTLWAGNRARSSHSAVWHKSWANSVPSQHLKSELILKIHSVMNSIK